MPGARDRAASPRLSIEAAGLKISRHAIAVENAIVRAGADPTIARRATLHEVDRLNLMLVI